jgi:hypothetical protein
VKSFLLAVWYEQDGVLTFEWILLVTLLTIGIVGGLAAVRDAIIDELGDVAQAMLALDQSYCIDAPLSISVVHAQLTCGASDSSFVDSLQFADCARVCDPIGQGTVIDDGTPIMP